MLADEGEMMGFTALLVKIDIYSFTTGRKLRLHSVALWDRTEILGFFFLISFFSY